MQGSGYHIEHRKNLIDQSTVVCQNIIMIVLSDENINVIKELHIPELIMQGVEEHRAIPELVKNGFLALAAIVDADGKISEARSFLLTSFS